MKLFFQILYARTRCQIYDAKHGGCLAIVVKNIMQSDVEKLAKLAKVVIMNKY